MTEQHTLTKYTAAFVDELVRSGTRHAVISPGSRSTPLALLLAEHSSISTWLHVDERSAAFFALGLAKAKNEPVAILCTSGTAAANYYPAVVEAKLARVPLIVLTADRPHELRDSGAPQTIDQVRLFSTYPKWFVDMALPEETEDMLHYSRICASRAVANATDAPAGPVHVNFPFREPLLPNLSLPSLWESSRTDGSPFTTVVTGDRHVSETQLEQLGKKISRSSKGLIVCGPSDNLEDQADIIALAEKLRFPVLTDPLSQLRTGTHDKALIIDSYDAFLRVKQFVEKYKPELIIRFGAMPVSKPLLLFIQNNPHCQQIIVDEGTGWRDPTLSADYMVYVKPSTFCEKMGDIIQLQNKQENEAWLRVWQEVNSLTKNVILRSIKRSTLNEGQLMLEAVSMLPDNALLFVGNSMPIRDLDTFLFTSEKQLVTMGNRGANGIDGIVSTALGASTHFKSSVLVIGDLSFFHDLNGLLAAKLYNLNLTIVVVNNDGGGIFSFLPQAESKLPYFEQLFGTPIGLDFHHAVEMYGGTFKRVRNWDEFRNVYKNSVNETGLHVIEVVTERQENVNIHRDIWSKVEKEILTNFM